MDSLITLAQQALKQSNKMKELAAENQWDQLTEIQKAQAVIVEKIMIAEVESPIKDELRSILITIKETNNSVMGMAEEAKTDLIKEKKRLGQAAKMQKALDSIK